MSPRDNGSLAEIAPMRDRLQNKLVTLHRLGHGDMADICAAVRESLDHLIPWMPWCHAEYSIQETEAFVAKQMELWDAGEEFSFAIRDQQNLFAGLCGLNQFNRIHHLANLGYWLRKSCVHRGFATAATQSVLEFGLKDLNLQRIEILVPVDNYPSQRVAERAGAICEGILRSRLWIRDRAHDAVCYSVVQVTE